MASSSSQRFSSKSALTHGWRVRSVSRKEEFSLNLERGPPLKILSSKWVAPPLGWSTASDVIASAFIVRNASDLPSHAMNIAATGESSADIVTPSGSSGWKVAMDYQNWDQCGYGTFYWNNAAARSILDYTFRNHDIIPKGSGIAMRCGERVLQAFITGNKPSGSLTHFDETSSILYVVSGSKFVWIAPPGSEKFLDLRWLPDHTHTLAYNPDIDENRNEVVWQKVTLDANDALFIPKGWFHYVRSSENTVALSIALSPDNGSSKSVGALKVRASKRKRQPEASSRKRQAAEAVKKNSRELKVRVDETRSFKERQNQHDSTLSVDDDTSGSNWIGIKWVRFVVSKKCQRWPAAVLTGGQMIYIGQEPAVEVCDFTVLEDFQGTSADIKRATGGENVGDYLNLKRAIDEAIVWLRKNT
eukprot:g3410.t1